MGIITKGGAGSPQRVVQKHRTASSRDVNTLDTREQWEFSQPRKRKGFVEQAALGGASASQRQLGK